MTYGLAVMMRIWGLCLLLFLSACASDEMLIPKALPDASDKADVAAVDSQLDHADMVESVPFTPEVKLTPVLQHNIGDGQLSEGLVLPGEDLVLNSDGLPLARFIDMAFGELLGLDYEIDPILKNRNDAVSLHVSRPVPAKRLLAIIESTLQLYRVGLVSHDGMIQIVPINRLRGISPVFSQMLGDKIQLGRVVEFVPLFYINSREANELGRLFINSSNGDEMRYIESLNALMLIARPDSILRLREAIAMIDRPSLRGLHLRMLRPIYWKVDALIKTVSQLLAAQGVPVVKQAVDRNKGVFLFPITVLNAMMVISPQVVWLKSVQDMVAELDVPEAAGNGKKVFIYYVKNSRANDLGKIIAQVLGQADSSSQGAGVPVSSKAAKVVSTSRSRSIDGLKGLNVIVDDKRNALLFIGESGAYRAMLPLLASLDRAPKQVMLEVTVAEVSLDSSDQLGIEWQFNNVDKSSRLNGVLGTLGGLAAAGGGLTYALLNNAGNVRAQLSALATEGRTKILSSPKILVLDGESAKIQVGDQIPVVTQEVSSSQSTTAAGAGLLRSFSYVDTGVILEIAVTINEGGMVRIDLLQGVSEAGQAAAGGNPPIFKRNFKTKMMAHSGQTVVIGGMIRHTKTDRDTSVPFFGNIPLLGALFKSNSGSDRSTELLVMITPHVIRGNEDAEFISQAMKKELGWQDGVFK